MSLWIILNMDVGETTLYWRWYVAHLCYGNVKLRSGIIYEQHGLLRMRILVNNKCMKLWNKNDKQ